MGRSNDFMLDPYSEAASVEGMQGIIIGIVLLYVFLMLISLVKYVVSSYALYKIADNRKISNAWLAWIPVANQWALGSVVDYHEGLAGKKSAWRKVLITLDLIFIALFVLSYVVLFVSLIANIISWAEVEPTMSDMIGLLIPFYVCIFAVMLVASAFAVCNMICVYKVFENLVPSKSIKYLLISLLVPFGATVCLFLCKDSKEGLPCEADVLPVEPVGNVLVE